MLASCFLCFCPSCLQVDYGEFVLILAQLSALTNRFRAADATGVGAATLGYGQFLDLVFSAL